MECVCILYINIFIVYTLIHKRFMNSITIIYSDLDFIAYFKLFTKRFKIWQDEAYFVN